MAGGLFGCVRVGFGEDGKEWRIEVGGGIDFEVGHGGGVTERNLVETAEDGDRSALGAFAHEEDGHASERVDEIDFGNFHGATKKVGFAANVF